MIKERCFNSGSEVLVLANGDTLRIDRGMAFVIDLLNSRGIKTLGCCSGHGKYKTTIIIKEREVIKELITGIEIPREKRFYVKDKEGFYFIPEIDKEFKK